MQPCAVLRTWSGLRPDTPPTPHGTRKIPRTVHRSLIRQTENRGARASGVGSDFVIDDGTGKTLGMVVGVTQ
ncbi:hypothetical protein LPA81_23695 (plasmid) [Salmonella enterica subsp. enterica]|uniref:hypothetical protein n=1 Tax=Salmonella enterica TaxID=28901 RepID=UPI00352AE1E2